MKTSESIKNIATALCNAQHEIKGAVKDSTNPFFKSSYADLQSVITAIKEAAFKNGLSYTQPTAFIELGENNHQLVVATRIMHNSGEWIEGQYPISPTKPDPQSLGSAISYSRRYALAAIFGVAQIDDDAEAVTHTTNKYPNKWETKTTQQATPQAQASNLISDAQRIRLFSIAKTNGYTEADIKTYLKEYCGIESSKQILKADYDAIVNDFSAPSESKLAEQQPHGVV